MEENTEKPRCRVADVRRQQPYDVYAGRAGYDDEGVWQDGYFGNPIRPHVTCTICGEAHEHRGDTVPCFKIYFHRRLAADPEYKARIHALRGKVLGCFCGGWPSSNRPCHAVVIADYVNSLDDKELS
jgi:hypothetical protein